MANEVNFFNVTLIWRVTVKKASPFTSLKLECLAAKDKSDARARALALFGPMATQLLIVEITAL